MKSAGSDTTSFSLTGPPEVKHLGCLGPRSSYGPLFSDVSEGQTRSFPGMLRSLCLWLVILVLAPASAHAGSAGGAAQNEEERSLRSVENRARPGYLEDETVCGFWTERLLSGLYHLLAGRPDENRVAGVVGLERVAFITKDRRNLGGYKLQAYADRSRPARGYVLVALGNAMLADQVVGQFRFLQSEGFDVFVYDYRGYGISEGRSRFSAIRSDYIELIQHLSAAGYANRFLYGMSLGGVFLLNAIKAGAPYDAAMIDSPPSRISNYGCPRQFDPVENVPDDSSRLGFIFGHRDTVVPPSAWRALSEAAKARGAVVSEHADLAHPMMDVDPAARRIRFEAVRAFFVSHVR